jgi:hypothetical protein
MKKILLLPLIFISIITAHNISQTTDIIEKQALRSPKIILTQNDFLSGTYRIKKGGYYQLNSNISFYPDKVQEKLRTDKPEVGWFAAITIETNDGVVIDLNNCILQADQKFVDEHLFNVFANVELDNCPFSGKLFGFPDPAHAFINFAGDNKYIAAENVIIKNGTLGRSGHWGIHGNNNKNIFAHNLLIKDWEVRGIELIGLRNGVIKNVEISGLEHTINTSVPLVGALQVKGMLQQLIKYGFYHAEEQYNKLTNFIANNPGYLNPAQSLANGTIGGIFLTGGGVSNVGFPVTNAMCAHAAAMTGGGITCNVEIENVYVHDIGVNSVQHVSIGSNLQGPDGNIIRLEGVGILPGASLFWHDAYDKNGKFAPNEVLRSIMLIARAMIHYKPELKKTLPKNFIKIADSILNGDHAQFLKQVKPVFTYPSHKIKGLFGIRIEGAQNVHVKSCKVENLKSIGEPCQELSDIFDAKYFIAEKTRHSASQEDRDAEYRGNDIWAYECAASDLCVFSDCIAHNIESYHGNPFGFELIADVQDSRIIRCIADSIIGYSDLLNSNLNLPSESYGFRVQRTDKKNYFINCKAQNISAPRRSFGFAAEECVYAQFKNCNANNVYSTSSIDSNDAVRQKVAYGFNTEMAVATEFLECQACDIRNENENNSPYKTHSIAAGIACTQNSQQSAIIGCSIINVNSGAGNAAGIYSEDENKIAYSNNTIGKIIANSENGFATEMIMPL